MEQMRNYAVVTVLLATPGDHWASGKLLGDAADSCAGATESPSASLGWFFALRLELSLQRLWRVKWSLCETPES